MCSLIFNFRKILSFNFKRKMHTNFSRSPIFHMRKFDEFGKRTNVLYTRTKRRNQRGLSLTHMLSLSLLTAKLSNFSISSSSFYSLWYRTEKVFFYHAIKGFDLIIFFSPCSSFFISLLFHNISFIQLLTRKLVKFEQIFCLLLLCGGCCAI